MRILSIDSSLGTQLLVCDAVRGAGAPVSLRVLASAQQPDPRRHAESLGPMLARALADPAVADAPLGAVVAATGPAPFTGLRAGLVTARTVGRARGIPVYGVPSLDAVARAAFDELAQERGQEAAAGATIIVLTDARRREVYSAAYRARGADDVERLTDLRVGAPDRAREGVGERALLAGSGARQYASVLGDAPVLAAASGDGATQVRIALARLARGEELGTEPLYLRHADVQAPRPRKRVQ